MENVSKSSSFYNTTFYTIEKSKKKIFIKVPNVCNLIQKNVEKIGAFLLTKICLSEQKIIKNATPII